MGDRSWSWESVGRQCWEKVMSVSAASSPWAWTSCSGARQQTRAVSQRKGRMVPRRWWGASRQRCTPWARGISLFCSWVVHCSAGSSSVAALASHRIAHMAVVKTRRWLRTPLPSHWWEPTRMFLDVFCMWTTWAFSKLRTNSKFEACVLKGMVPTSDIPRISKVEGLFLIVIKVTCCLKQVVLM